MKINNFKSVLNKDQLNSGAREEEKKTTIIKKYISKKQDISGFLSVNSSKILNIENIKTNRSIIIENEKTPKKKVIKKKEKNIFLLEFENCKMYNFENFEYAKFGQEFNVIGKGAYSEVFLAKNKINEKYYAIKKIKKYPKISKGSSDFSDKLPPEILIHRRIIHENIVRAYSHFEDNDFYYIIVEYVDNGNLYHKIIQSRNGFTESQAFVYFKQVVKALEFLHENYLVHRDLKPENILINKKDKVKLCDFGCCVDIRNGFRETFCGTFEYMAPEIIRELPYNQGVDIWSLGILLYEMIHGHSPFCKKSDDNNRDLSQIFRNILTHNLSFKKEVSDSCKDLIKKLLSKKNEERIKISEIKYHTWFIDQRNLEDKSNDKIHENSNNNIFEGGLSSEDILLKNKLSSEINSEKKLSNNSNLEENKIEAFQFTKNFKNEEILKQNKLKLLKENINSQKSQIEKNVDLAITLPKFQNIDNDKESTPIGDLEETQEQKLIGDLDLDKFSSLSKIMKRKRENLNKKNQEKRNLLIEEEFEYQNNFQNNFLNNNQIDKKTTNITNKDVINHNNIKNHYNSNFNEKDNIINNNFDSVHKNTQEELFEKVLDNIKYKKKCKISNKIANENNAEQTVDANKFEYENILAFEKSNHNSKEKNSWNLYKNSKKISADNMKAGFSTHITSERNSDNLSNNIFSLRIKKESFREILNGDNENENFNSKNNYFTNYLTTEVNNNDINNNHFNLFEKFDDISSNIDEGENNDKLKKINKQTKNVIFQKAYNDLNNGKKYPNKSNLNAFEFINDENKNDFSGSIKNFNLNQLNNKNNLITKQKEEIKKNIHKENFQKEEIFNLQFEENNLDFDLQVMKNDKLSENMRVNKINLNKKNQLKDFKIIENNNMIKSLNSEEFSDRIYKNKKENLKRLDSKFNNSVYLNESNFKNQKESNISRRNNIKNKNYQDETKFNLFENSDRGSIYKEEDNLSQIRDYNQFSSIDEYGSNKKQQEKTLAILKNAKLKKESLNLGVEKPDDDNFWNKVGNFFGIFKCNNAK